MLPTAMPNRRDARPDQDWSSGSSVEDAVDALEDGDRTIRVGTARAALQYPVFRRVYLGAFISNVGSWMQNVVLGALAYDLTHSPTFVGILVFAQLGPLLLFSLVGGLLADSLDRRRLLIGVSITQGLLSLALAAVVRSDDPSRVLMVLVVFAIGMGQAIFGPTYGAVLPSLVDKKDLAGAISLNSVQMNGSRVIGPVIGSAMAVRLGESSVFIVNAASYLLVLWGLHGIKLPAPVVPEQQLTPLRRIAAGVRAARNDTVIWRCLLIVFLFSLLSLTFVGQLPTVADLNLGIEAKSQEYGFLYTCFGIGALLGALSIGTVLAGRDLAQVARRGLALFAGFLGLFAFVRSPGLAYPMILLVGLAYFAVITSLSTVLQQQLEDRDRGRVMALWIMAFGGTVPIGNLIAGPVIEATSVTAVVLFGAIVAGMLAVVRLGPAVAVAPGDATS
ncbi:MAG: MFS transporter [Actinomycetota bacterium]|nr:MFS transporter [Actinomycetota bacterium]